MFNMLFTDILTFMMPAFLESLMTGHADDIKITQELLLVFAVVLEIPIIMIFLSRVLKPKLNRIFNMVAAVITILFVVGGGSLMYHYVFFATIEVACLLVIILFSFKWDEMTDDWE